MSTGALPVLIAVTGRWESVLVGGLEGHASAVVVVRRCADVGDLLATAATGQARAVIVSADLRQLDGEALQRLALAGTGVVALVEPGDEGAERRLRQLGVDHVLPADAQAQDVARAVTTAVAQLARTNRRLGTERLGTERTGAELPGAELPGAELPGAELPGAELPGAERLDSERPVSELPGAERPVSERLVTEQVRAERPGAERPVSERLGAAAGADDVAASSAARATSRPSSAHGDPRAALAREQAPDEPVGLPAGTGSVIAVWGPAGAPGRTTTAVALAVELAESGEASLLVDADTYAASIAQVLGLLDEAPGLASAARAADHGTLDLYQLSRLAPQVSDRMRVLTGISSAQRWPELRPASLRTVLRLARSLSPWTVVDTAPYVEQDEELSYDTAAPRRNGATLAVLEDADVVVAVGSADPVGLQRLVRGLQDLASVTDVRPQVVVNRVRSSAVGPRPDEKVRRALERYAGVQDVVLVPDDARSLDAALLQGRTLAEVAPSSPARLALAGLAGSLSGRPVTGGRRRASRPHRRGA